MRGTGARGRFARKSSSFRSVSVVLPRNLGLTRPSTSLIEEERARARSTLGNVSLPRMTARLRCSARAFLPLLLSSPPGAAVVGLFSGVPPSSASHEDAPIAGRAALHRLSRPPCPTNLDT